LRIADLGLRIEKPLPPIPNPKSEISAMAFSRPKPRTARLDGGFTLIELVLVLLLLTIIVGTAIPSVKGFLGWSRSRDTIAQIVAMSQYARSKAATEAKTYKLGADGTTCWLEVQEGEAFNRVENDELAAPIEVPEGAVVEFVPSTKTNNTAGITSSSTYAAQQSSSAASAALTARDGILFYPDGRTSPGAIRYTSPAGVPSILASPSPSESFRVMSAQEAQRL
jgi:prepilin-type N-terminal cleavage/methylation domain-containing protein